MTNRIARKQWGASTECIWGGEPEHKPLGATMMPIFQGATFAYETLEEWRAVGAGEQSGHIYNRNTNPTVAVFEQKVAALEGAQAATSFSSGMAAISNTLFALLKSGSRVVTVRDIYGGSNLVFSEFLPRFGVDVVFCDTDDEAAIRKAIAAGCDLLYLETPTNPTLKVLDIQALTSLAHDAGAVVVVDNSLAGPLNQRPLQLGADIVVYSAAKSLGGHADVMGGVMCGDRQRVEQVFHFREINGACLEPMSAYLLMRGMQTLELRNSRQNDSAMRIAGFLESHPLVERVFYPGLACHPGAAIALRQMSGFGGVLSFSLLGGYESVRIVLESLQLAHLAASFGSVSTHAGAPCTTSHIEMSAAERTAAGIPESLIRYSVGIEDVTDLIEDLAMALDRVSAAIPKSA